MRRFCQARFKVRARPRSIAITSRLLSASTRLLLLYCNKSYKCCNCFHFDTTPEVYTNEPFLRIFTVSGSYSRGERPRQLFYLEECGSQIGSRTLHCDTRLWTSSAYETLKRITLKPQRGRNTFLVTVLQKAWASRRFQHIGTLLLGRHPSPIH